MVASSRITIDGVAGVLPVLVVYGYTIDGSAVQQPTKEGTSSTATQTSVASSGSAVMLLQGNNLRLGATIFNDSAQVLYLGLLHFVFAVSTTQYTAQVAPGGYYEVPAGYYNQVSGIWAAPNGFARITEFT